MKNNYSTMKTENLTYHLFSWSLGLIVLTIGIFNIILVHPVPGIIAILLSMLFFPSTNTFLQKKFGFSIPFVAKIILALIIIWFTLGVSDLGDIIDDQLAVFQ